jgi:hypothetical protein
LKWRALPPDVANAMKPVDGVGYEAWHVTDGGQQYLIGVNTGTFRGKKTEVCSVAANHRPDILIPLVLKALKPRLLERDSVGFQISETYELKHPTQPVALLMITRATDNQPPVTFGFLGVR